MTRALTEFAYSVVAITKRVRVLNTLEVLCWAGMCKQPKSHTGELEYYNRYGDLRYQRDRDNTLQLTCNEAGSSPKGLNAGFEDGTRGLCDEALFSVSSSLSISFQSISSPTSLIMRTR